MDGENTILQVIYKINSKNHNSLKTESLLARTAYLGNKERCQLSLNKIINQIMSFIFKKNNQSIKTLDLN